MINPDFSGLSSSVIEATSFIFKPKADIPLRMRDVDQDGLERAVYCASILQQRGRLGNYRIGIVDPNIPQCISLGGIRRGEVLLYEVEADGTVSIQQPYSKEHIAANSKKGTGLISSTGINYPSCFFRDIVR